MKYQLLSKKAPPFETKLVLIHEDDTWDEGYLKEKLETKSGTSYTFTMGENEYTKVKYWGIPTPPKE